MDRLQAGFLKILRLIGDYLPQVVIAGGWAPFVYYRYLLCDKSKNPLRTGDIDQIVSELIGLRERYKPWFKTFKENLGKAFTDIGSEAVSLTKEQRPPGAFRALTDSQLAQYILLTFQEFLSSFP